MIDYSKWHKEEAVPSWDEYFLKIADDVKLRSKDANTKHGCVLVDENNHILGTGYNSFPKGFWDNLLPNNRISDTEPDCPKYHWMLHAERNAVKNITTRHYTSLTSYQTGFPCHNCLLDLHQSGVKRIVVSNRGPSHQFFHEEQELINFTLLMSGIYIETLNEYYSWINERGKYIFKWYLKSNRKETER